MNKKLVMALTAALTLITIASPAKAETPKPTLAILDTALDTSLPIFTGRIAQEVCILDWNSCPNKTSYMEGPGATVMPANLISKNGFDHGTQMASIAVKANPNMNIVFIRIIGSTSTGVRQITSEATVYKALNWVAANKDKYNIQAVAMSQGRHDFATRFSYCFNTPTTQKSINTLISMNIPTFFAAGNSRDYERIDWPSCIPESISIGAVDQYGEVALYSNYDKALLDFYALGNTVATKPGGSVSNVAGTSASTQIAAAQWIQLKSANPALSYQELYALITNTSKPVFNSKITGGKLISIGGN